MGNGNKYQLLLEIVSLKVSLGLKFEVSSIRKYVMEEITYIDLPKDLLTHLQLDLLAEDVV